MATPNREDWINQAIDEVAAVLESSELFMSGEVLPGARGLVKKVEKNIPDPTAIPKANLPHAGVVYMGHEPSDGDTIGTTSYKVNIGIQLTGRGADRVALWERLQKVAASIQPIVSEQNKGDLFDGYANLAIALGGTAIEDQEDRTFTAIIQTGISLDVTLED